MKTQLLVAGCLLAVVPVWATPTFQVYIDGGVAGSQGLDEDTWFTTDTSFDLIAVGAFGPKTVVMDQVTLLVSVPKGQTGNLIINGASIMTSKLQVGSSVYYNPNVNADIDVLGNVAGLDGYSNKSFLPDAQKLENNHYPFQTSVSDFLIFDLGSFQNLGSIANYSTEEGISLDAGSGEQKKFAVEVSGFDWVHFDLYGYQIDAKGKSSFQSTWDKSANSHDSAYLDSDIYCPRPQVPAPGAVLLGSLGVAIVGFLRKRIS